MLRIKVISEWDHVDLRKRAYGYAKEIIEDMQFWEEKEREAGENLIMDVAEAYEGGIPEDVLNDYLAYQFLEDLKEREREEAEA